MENPPFKISWKLYLQILGYVSLRVVFSSIEISWLGKYFTLHRVIHSYVQNITHSFMGTIASRNVNHSWVVPTASVLKAIRNVRRCWAEMGLGRD